MTLPVMRPREGAPELTAKSCLGPASLGPAPLGPKTGLHKQSPLVPTHGAESLSLLVVSREARQGEVCWSRGDATTHDHGTFTLSQDGQGPTPTLHSCTITPLRAKSTITL